MSGEVLLANSWHHTCAPIQIGGIHRVDFSVSGTAHGPYSGTFIANGSWYNRAGSSVDFVENLAITSGLQRFRAAFATRSGFAASCNRLDVSITMKWGITVLHILKSPHERLVFKETFANGPTQSWRLL